MFIKLKINSRYCKYVIFMDAKTIIFYNLNTIVYVLYEGFGFINESTLFMTVLKFGLF